MRKIAIFVKKIKEKWQVQGANQLAHKNQFAHLGGRDEERRMGKKELWGLSFAELSTVGGEGEGNDVLFALVGVDLELKGLFCFCRFCSCR